MQQDANGHRSLPCSPYSGKIPTAHWVPHAVLAFLGLPPAECNAAENPASSDGKQFIWIL